MLMTIDVGNTHTVVGIYKKDDFLHTWRFATKTFETEDEIFSFLSNLMKNAKIEPHQIEGVTIASVVPKVNYFLKRLAEKYFKVNALFVSYSGYKKIKWDVDYPQEIGADRVANVIAMKEFYGENVIGIDFGTAITIDVLERNAFKGGAIIPGFRTMMLSLFSNTAKLPQVELDFCEKDIGANTVENIQIGVVNTIIFGLNELIKRIERKAPFKIVITGGMASIAKKGLNFAYTYDKTLTLKGIVKYFEVVSEK